MTEQLLPPANWYADPEGSGRWRYWDGSGWTGVYLNQTKPAPSLWRQYAERFRPAGLVLGLVSITLWALVGWDTDFFVLGVVLLTAVAPADGGAWSTATRVLFFLIAIAGLVLQIDWPYGASAAGCIAVAALVGSFRERLPQWLEWTLMAFALTGFGVFLAAGIAPWRG